MITAIPSLDFPLISLFIILYVKNSYFNKLDCNQRHPHFLLKIKYHLVFIKSIIKTPRLYLFCSFFEISKIHTEATK